MNGIGGFFELELPRNEEYHKDAIRLNSGRNCLEYVLLLRQYKTVYIPYYTCNAILEPFEKLGIKYKFYSITLDFEIAEDIKLNDKEALLYTNYYGIKDEYTFWLASKYGSNLILDCTQAFFSPPIDGIDTFYSCRKFFGVPDGAYLYCDANRNIELDIDNSYNRFAHLLKRIDLSPEQAYEDFQNCEKSLIAQPIRLMSKLTQRLMQSIDYNQVCNIRKENFQILASRINHKNKLNLPTESTYKCPMVYPFLSQNKDSRRQLLESKIYVAQYWPNVVEYSRKNSVDYLLYEKLFPLPIDQRYNKEDMRIISEKIVL